MRNSFKQLIFSLLIALITGITGLSQSIDLESNLILKITKKVEEYNNLYPQQKVYLHIDKTRYTIEDRLWFKAYVLDASTHLPDSKSSNLYVELINPSGYLVQAKRIRLTNGFGNGDFSFQDTIPEGWYLIRAYTNWMMNREPDFFFQKNVYIKNPSYKIYATREDVRKVKKAKKQAEKSYSNYDISFHPEGGNLLLEVENKVAFKAINDAGISVQIEGKLVDSKSNTILTVKSQHAGMGYFSFTPERDEKYFFIAEAEGNKSKKFKLPEAKELGINLRIIEENENEIKVGLSTNLVSKNFPSNPVYAIIAHTRGVVKFSGEIDIRNENPSITIPKNLFPNGILHLTLFNYRESAISERLIFINDGNSLGINVIPAKNNIAQRENSKALVHITGINDQEIKGSYSAAIVKSDKIFNSDNIMSNLLLNSDLKGNIENPTYYFNNISQEKRNHLDLLMLTQGWKRFTWPEVILNSKTDPEYHFQKGIEIYGKITRELFGIPLRDIKVTLVLLDKYNDTYVTRSGEKGEFLFDNLDYSDTMKVKINATRANGKKNLVIILEDDIADKLKNHDYLTEQYLSKPGEEGKKKNLYVEEEEDDPFKEENNRINRIHNEPNKSNVIIMDDHLRNMGSLANVLHGRVAGVHVTGNTVVIRGNSSITGSNAPFYLIDGIPADEDVALSISPYDVERIEILKGPEAAIYGSRGGNGVIAIYTRRGKFMIKGEIEFKMMGYSTPAEYYSPKYEINKDETLEDSRTTLMWIPNLEIDDEGNASIEFTGSDKQGNYLIIVEGITEEGTPGYGSSKINLN